MYHSSKSILTSKRTSSGATLLEVLVSIFLLTFGVLGLMAAQIRSIASISEAENRTIVSQAVDNLADNMQINPHISQLGSGNNIRVVRTYPNYVTSAPKTGTPNPNAKQPAALWGSGSQSGITKTALAENHIRSFEASLSQIPNASSIYYVICLDKNEAEDPIFDKTGRITNMNCRPGNGALDNKTAIKVVWAVRSNNSDEDAAVFTYQMRLPL